VEIAKALAVSARIIVMDEPSATLTPAEVDRLFQIIRELKAQGIGVIYISHRLDEIFAIADRVSVLRDGRRQVVGAEEVVVDGSFSRPAAEIRSVVQGGANVTSTSTRSARAERRSATVARMSSTAGQPTNVGRMSTWIRSGPTSIAPTIPSSTMLTFGISGSATEARASMTCARLGTRRAPARAPDGGGEVIVTTPPRGPIAEPT